MRENLVTNSIPMQPVNTIPIASHLVNVNVDLRVDD